MPSKLYKQKSMPKLSSTVATLDPNIFDPSTRSESSPRKSESYKSPLISTKTSSSLSAAGAENNLSSTNSSIYKSATETPSIDDSSDSNESFYSVSQSQDEKGPISEPKSENDIKDGKSSTYSQSDLDEEDLFTTKKLLGKLCKTMVESSCHHGKKGQQLNANLCKLENSFVDNVSVLNDFVIDFDLKSADKVETMIGKLDPQMTALEEITRFSYNLHLLVGLDEWLDLADAENQRDLNALENAKQILHKQKEVENQVKHLEEQTNKHRDIFNAIEFSDPIMLRQAIAASKKSSSGGYKRYGVKENKHFIPGFLADIKDFETNLSEMKRFFLPAGLLHQSFFNKMEILLENVKTEITEHCEPLSTASSMASLYFVENPIAYSTSAYQHMDSSIDDDDELEIEVSRSATDHSNSDETSLSLSNESIQPSVYDTVEDSTQASSKTCDTVASTQASSFDTVDATQLSASNESIPQTSSSVSTCSSYELECDNTQSSDASLKTAISPQSSSLKTALSWDDLMGSSSTIAI